MPVSSIIGISASSLFLEQELRTNARAKEHKTDFNKFLFITDLALNLKR
jgi:hypothetical protein